MTDDRPDRQPRPSRHRYAAQSSPSPSNPTAPLPKDGRTSRYLLHDAHGDIAGSACCRSCAMGGIPEPYDRLPIGRGIIIVAVLGGVVAVAGGLIGAAMRAAGMW